MVHFKWKHLPPNLFLEIWNVHERVWSNIFVFCMFKGHLPIYNKLTKTKEVFSHQVFSETTAAVNRRLACLNLCLYHLLRNAVSLRNFLTHANTCLSIMSMQNIVGYSDLDCIFDSHDWYHIYINSTYTILCYILQILRTNISTCTCHAYAYYLTVSYISCCRVNYLVWTLFSIWWTYFHFIIP